MNRIFLLIAVLFLSSFYGFSSVNDDVIAAARKGLPYFVGLIPNGQQTLYGFSADDNLQHCSVGKPFRIISLRQDFYDSSYSAEKNYLVPGKMWRVPVISNGTCRMLLTVAGEQGNYNAVEIGGAVLANELGQMSANANNNDNYYILRIHPLSCDFFVDAAGPTLDGAGFIPLASALSAMPSLNNRTYSLDELLPLIKASLIQPGK
jgi:hypothetical protein